MTGAKLKVKDEKRKETLVIVYESRTQKIVSQLRFTAMMTLPIFVGWLMQSDAMQWMGFVISLPMVAALGRKMEGSARDCATVDEAIELLQQWKAGP